MTQTLNRRRCRVPPPQRATGLEDFWQQKVELNDGRSTAGKTRCSHRGDKVRLVSRSRQIVGGTKLNEKTNQHSNLSEGRECRLVLTTTKTSMEKISQMDVTYQKSTLAANHSVATPLVKPATFHRWAAGVIRDIADRYGDKATLSWQTLRDLQVPQELRRSLRSNAERHEGAPLHELLWSAVELLQIELEVDERLRGRSDIGSLREAVIAAIDQCFGPDDDFETVELWRAEEEFTDSFPPDLSA